jgi:hypothetical protein
VTDHDSRNGYARVPPREEESPEGGGTVDGECVLVPEGEYELRYVDYETATYFGSSKVVVHFAIVRPEEYAGLPVDRFYNVKQLSGPPGLYGNYVATHRGDLKREYRKIVGTTGRLDRISFKQFKDQRIIGQIETVRFDYKRDPLAESERYSRIKKLDSVLPGDDW